MDTSSDEPVQSGVRDTPNYPDATVDHSSTPTHASHDFGGGGWTHFDGVADDAGSTSCYLPGVPVAETPSFTLLTPRPVQPKENPSTPTLPGDDPDGFWNFANLGSQLPHANDTTSDGSTSFLDAGVPLAENPPIIGFTAVTVSPTISDRPEYTSITPTHASHDFRGGGWTHFDGVADDAGSTSCYVPGVPVAETPSVTLLTPGPVQPTSPARPKEEPSTPTGDESVNIRERWRMVQEGGDVKDGKPVKINVIDRYASSANGIKKGDIKLLRLNFAGCNVDQVDSAGKCFLIPSTYATGVELDEVERQLQTHAWSVDIVMNGKEIGLVKETADKMFPQGTILLNGEVVANTALKKPVDLVQLPPVLRPTKYGRPVKEHTKVKGRIVGLEEVDESLYVAFYIEGFSQYIYCVLAKKKWEPSPEF